jgi:hypothetical protein
MGTLLATSSGRPGATSPQFLEIDLTVSLSGERTKAVNVLSLFRIRKSNMINDAMNRDVKVAESAQGRLSVIGMVWATLFVLAFAGLAEQEPRNDTFSCISNNGQRNFCPVDPSRGEFRLVRSLSSVRCVEGYNWGRENNGVWVDHGCRAEFSAASGPRRHVENSTRIEAGMTMPVRTNEAIRTKRADGRIFTGEVSDDVLGSNGELAIPRGSSVELMVRVAQDRDLILDLESVVVNGQRYGIDASPERIESRDGIGANQRTGKFVGGGAAIGAIIGAIAGGGKGAAIGAGVGAAGGAVGLIATRGSEVKVPAETVITFRVERALTMGIADGGRIGRGRHYHEMSGRP